MKASALVSNHAPIPGMQRIGPGQHPRAHSRAPQGCGDRSQQGPIVVVGSRPVDFAAQHGVLVAEDDDLEVFGVAGTDREAGQGSQESVDDAKHGEPGWRDRPWSAPTRHFPGTTGAAYETAT